MHFLALTLQPWHTFKPWIKEYPCISVFMICTEDPSRTDLPAEKSRIKYKSHDLLAVETSTTSLWYVSTTSTGCIEAYDLLLLSVWLLLDLPSQLLGDEILKPWSPTENQDNTSILDVSVAWTWPDSHPDPRRVRFWPNPERFWGRETETKAGPCARDRIHTAAAFRVARVACFPDFLILRLGYATLRITNQVGALGTWNHVWHQCFRNRYLYLI